MRNSYLGCEVGGECSESLPRAIHGVQLLDAQSLIMVFVLSLLPTFEGRYAVVVGMKLANPVEAIAIACIASVFLGIALAYTMPLIDAIASTLSRSGIGLFKKVGTAYLRYLQNVRKRVEPYVKRYGFLGLVLFVAIPLPATGIWTGALAAYILGLERRRTAIALVLGGLISIAITVSVALPAASLWR